MKILYWFFFTVIDSFGKSSSGLFEGNLFWVGEYEECIGINEEKFTGKYCYIYEQVKYFGVLDFYFVSKHLFYFQFDSI